LSAAATRKELRPLVFLPFLPHILEPVQEARGRQVVWSHPAFAERCVFARNDKEMVCISLAAG
jgi:hypothetical protein